MKLYIMTDVSRISAVLWGGLGLPPWFNFPELAGDKLRLSMTETVNRAVRGARAAGISECVVHEACPLDWPSLDDVSVVRGGETLYLDGSFAGIAFVGQGLVGHVRSTTGVETNLQEIKWNGRRVDELTIFALYAGALGIPTVMVHGASCVLETLLKWMPDAPVGEDVENELTANLLNGRFCRPVLPNGEITTSLRFRVPQLANFHALLPGVNRIDDVTTETHSAGVAGAFADYCRSGLAAVADWLENTGVHASCKN
ncbi:MAG TPA: M55 family metallopeptidase [bacterium]|nr:M55 family metallopeptidase [bacterium]